MLICLFEDDVSTLEPLTLTRPAFDLRCGQTTLREKHLRYFGATTLATWIRRHLTGLYYRTRLLPRESGPMAYHPAFWMGQPLVFVNARWLPPAGSVELLEDPCVALAGDEVAYVFLQQAPPGALAGPVAEHLQHWRQTLPQREAGGTLVKYPWELVDHNAGQIIQDFEQGDRCSVFRVRPRSPWLAPANCW